MTIPITFFRSEKEKNLLTKEEEQALGKRIVKGRVWRVVDGKKRPQPFLSIDAKKAGRELAAHNPRLVMHAVMRYDSKHISPDDLFGFGCIGLCEATKWWDWRKSKFSTYAYFWIKKSILRCMETSSRVVKIPTNIRSELRKATSKTKFVGKTAPALEAMRRGLYQEQSLSREYNPSDKGIGDPANATEREERRDQIFRAMKYLSQRERDVLVLRFIHRMTIKEIASRMHMRRKNVQRVSTEGIKKVRRRIRIEEAHEGVIIR